MIRGSMVLLGGLVVLGACMAERPRVMEARGMAAPVAILTAPPPKPLPTFCLADGDCPGGHCSLETLAMNPEDGAMVGQCLPERSLCGDPCPGACACDPIVAACVDTDVYFAGEGPPVAEPCFR